MRLARPSPPTLRFFSWAPPTISLGYGQALDGRVDLAAAADMEIGLVRRPTGGSAILHEGPDLEVTYSVVAGVVLLGLSGYGVGLAAERAGESRSVPRVAHINGNQDEHDGGRFRVCEPHMAAAQSAY